VAVKLTPGNVHDGAPVEQLTQNLTGKLFGDKGYLGKQRAAPLLKRGLVLLTKVRKNMKALPLTLTDKLLLNARNMAETIIGHIKAFSSLNLPRHRAPINAFLQLLATLTAYQLNPIKPGCLLISSRSLEERMTLILLELSANFGVRDPQEVQLMMWPSHQDLAELVGATRQRVTSISPALSAST